MKHLKNPEFWIVIGLAIAAIVTIILVFPYTKSSLSMEKHLIFHWFGWTGAVYLAVATPVYITLKRRFPQRYQAIMRLHILGNLLALLVVAFHFGYQLGTPPMFGTRTHLGLILVTSFIFFLVSGLIMRYQLSRKYMKPFRFIHLSLVTTFYMVIVFHVLHGLNVI